MIYYGKTLSSSGPKLTAVQDSKSRVKKFLILGHELTIADGTLTPSLKVKRNHIYQTYANQIESLFQESVSAIS